MRPFLRSAAALLLTLASCGGPETPNADNAFNDGETFAENANSGGKEDTGYITNLDAREVEMTLEADVVAPAYDKPRAPLASGQFALTYFRENEQIFIQSLAEDFTRTGEEQVLWKAGTSWKRWADMTKTERTAAKRFQLTKVNAVILNASTRSLAAGKSFNATVPLKPTTLFADMGRKCEGGDGHIQADADVYWYVWDPSKSTCTAQKQTATATVTTVLPKGRTIYPEYNKLYADKKLDVIAFFGAVDHDANPNDYAYTLIRSLETSLKNAGFAKGTAARGLRYSRTKLGITAVVDIYSPKEFSGLTDSAHVQNFYDAVKTHEVIVFNGHSVLGASDFWASPSIYQDPTKYQVFLYNGCLGYEYYVAPILRGKKSEANVDIVSNVIETPFAIMVQETATSISMMLAKAEKGGVSSWQSILGRMNDIAGEDAFYGASGARTNTYRPPR